MSTSVEGNDLLILMLSLSQMQSIPKIKKLYLEALNSFSASVVWSIDDYKKGSISYEIRAGNDSFGYLNCISGNENLENDSRLNIHNSTAILAVILQNRIRSDLLTKNNLDLQNRLMESNLFLNRLINNVPSAIYIYDIDKQSNIFTNTNFEVITGYLVSESTGSDFDFQRKLIYHDDYDRVMKYRYSMVSERKIPYGEIDYRIVRKDGNIIWVWSRDVPYQTDSEGNLKQILGIFNDITEYVKSDTLLKESLNEKGILLKEIHHRVKNNMQIIMSLLEMKSSHIDIPEYKRKFEECQSQIMSMARVHENIYRSELLNHINVKAYFKSILSDIGMFVNISHPGLKSRVECDEIEISIEKAIPLGLIINELVLNSHKHAFNDIEFPEIRISVENTGNIVKCRYSDNGCGYNADEQSGRTMGLTLVNSLINQIHGKINFESDRGAVCILEFPE